MIDFFEFSNEMLCVADHRGYLTRVNRAWTKTLGWSVDELTSRPYAEFMHPDDVEATAQEASLIFNNNHETVRFENRYRCRNGSYRWFAWQAILEPESNQLLATARDVTDEKIQAEALLESEERFRTLANYAPIGIAQSNAEGRIFFVNSKWCEIVGVQPEEAMGFEWKNFIHPDDFEEVIRAWQTSVQSGADMPTLEFRFLHKNGDIRWASSSVSLLKTTAGKVVARIASVQDITERKRAAESLESERSFLQHTIEFQDRQQRLMAYDIHDTIIQHTTAALLHIQGAITQVNTPELAGTIETAIGLLRKALVEGRRIMNGIRTPILDDLGIIPAIEQLVAEENQADRRVEFITSGNLGRMVLETEEALFRITQEALTNARKHSQSDSIRIEIARRGDRVTLEIRDWGVGFKSPARVKGVHGLKGMVERAQIAGGTCVVHSEPGKGTGVIVDLPYVIKK